MCVCVPGSKILTTFFATGEVDASLYQPNRVNFKPDWGFPLIAKLLLSGVTLALIIVLILLRFFIRLLRRVLKGRSA